MSTSIDVFVDTEQSLDEFAHELEQLLHLSFQREIDPVDNQIMYTFVNEASRMWIYQHEFDNDRDMLYEEYPYVIDIEARRFKEPEEVLALQKKLGYQVFEKLKETGKYRLLLVWDFQELLEQFEPGNTDN